MKKLILVFVAIAALLAAAVPVYADYSGYGHGRGSLPVYNQGHRYYAGPVYRGGYYGHGGYYGRGGFYGGIYIGPGWWGWPYYPYPYYYPYYSQPPVIQQDPVYEQQAPAQDQPYYWYFCPDAKAYYPYVKQCPGGWQKVVPKPPDKDKE